MTHAEASRRLLSIARRAKRLSRPCPPATRTRVPGDSAIVSQRPGGLARSNGVRLPLSKPSAKRMGAGGVAGTAVTLVVTSASALCLSAKRTRYQNVSVPWKPGAGM